MMHMWVLRLDVSGRPLDWVSQETAASLYCRAGVAWEAGVRVFRLHGGVSRATGRRSVLDVNSIIATGEYVEALRAVPALTNARLFRRDGHLCLYCGERFAPGQLTRDHVVPVSKGGRDVWTNVVSACRRCNHRKGDRSLAAVERFGMRLVALPYAPNLAEGLILSNRHILADQMAFLRARVGADSRLPALE
jgi:5-methylcytosine-specific restriction endonuclease McrA